MEIDLGHWDCGCVGFNIGDKQFTILSCDGKKASVGTANPSYNRFHPFKKLEDIESIIRAISTALEIAENARGLLEAFEDLKISSTSIKPNDKNPHN